MIWLNGITLAISCGAVVVSTVAWRRCVAARRRVEAAAAAIQAAQELPPYGEIIAHERG